MSRSHRFTLAAASLLLAALTTHCGSSSTTDGGAPPDGGSHDAGQMTDGGIDSGVADAGEDGGIDSGTNDAGFDAGTDAGVIDAGSSDSGTDAGADAGSDAGSDAGTDAGVDAGIDAGAVDAGPCGDGGAQVMHDDGLGGAFFDCAPLDTYDGAEAFAACSEHKHTWCASNYSCAFADGGLIECDGFNVPCNCWGYTYGTGGMVGVGHVSTSCGCPTDSDPVWH